MGFAILILPVAAILLFMLISRKTVMDLVNILFSSSMVAAGMLITKGVLDNGSVAYQLFDGLFYVDALSVITLDIVLLVGFLACIYSIGYLTVELKRNVFKVGKIRTYYILLYTFLFAVILALTVKNMGIMWIAIEATTLASAFLVGFYNSKTAIEAAWKYVIICSVGIAIALLGIVFLHMSYAEVPGLKGIQLDWTVLYENAKLLKTPILKLSFIFILIGFGTKAGLAPMHTWLPDAHSQAPAPVSALLSGVLLNSAVYAIIRTVAIVNRNFGSGAYSGRLLITFGLLSLVTAAVFIITQKDYKRLLAYSSIENMGIIVLSTGFFTKASVFAAIYHMINHSLTKSMLFLSSGSIFLKYDTRDISKVRGVLKSLPYSGTAMLLGLFAIAGTPPFSIFASKLNIITAIFAKKEFVAGVAIILLFAVIFTGMALAAFKMFYPGGAGRNSTAENTISIKTGSDIKSGEYGFTTVIPVLFLLFVISVSGLFMPVELKKLIYEAQKIVLP
jgi:hydrogenase-4 component F